MKTETILRKLDINNIVNEELNPIEEIEEVFDIYELIFIDRKSKEKLVVTFNPDTATFTYQENKKFNEQQLKSIMLYCNLITDKMKEELEEEYDIKDSIIQLLNEY